MASVMTQTTAAKITGQRTQQSVVTSFTNGLQVLIPPSFMENLGSAHAYSVLYYRPQRSCGKVMFLHLSVSHSVQVSVRETSPRDRDPQQRTLWTESPRTESPRTETPLGQRPPTWTETPHLDRDPPLGQRPPRDPPETPLPD